MATSKMAIQGYNYRYVSDLLEQLSEPGADISTLLRKEILEDNAGKPLPIELVQAVLHELQGEAAWQFLRAAQTLQIWKKHEDAWLLYQQFRLQQLRQPDNWRQHVPLCRRLWARAVPGSAIRGGAAYWLAAHGVGNDVHLLAALIEVAPQVTSPGYYVQRLRLWQQRCSEIEAILPQAINGLTDAWGWLGKERVADRAAVAALLALALRVRSPMAAGRLREEVETLLAVVPDTEGRSALQAALDALQTLPCCNTALRILSVEPSSANHLSDVQHRIRRLKEAELPSELDSRLWQVIRSVEVARRKNSSSAALQLLALAKPFVAQAGPEIAWAFHYLRAFLFRSRLEYHAALLTIEETRRLAGEAGSRHLLYKTHSLRHRIAHTMGLQEVEDESGAVLDILDQMSTLEGLPLGKRDEFTLASVFAVEDQAAQEYNVVRRRLQELRTVWADHHSGSGSLGGLGLAYFSQELASVTQKCERVLASLRDEPLLFAQMRFDLAQLALAARHEWSQNPTLYQATIKPCLDDAFRIATEMETYTFLGTIQLVVAKYKNSVLRSYEIPRELASPAALRHHTLEGISRLLRAVSTASERRMLLGVAQKMYAEYLDDDNSRVGALCVEEVHTLFELLQELKQPSLGDSSKLPAPLTKNTAPAEEAYTHNDEEIIIDDLSNPLQETWRTLVAQRLSRENALCLDFFFTGKEMFCFIIEGGDGNLNCRLVSLGIHQAGKLREVIQQWRNRFYFLISRYGSSIETHADSIAMSLDEDELWRNGDILLDPLEKILGDYHERALYIAPFLGLHGLPVHGIRAKSGWCLSDIGPVLHIAKARQLAEQRQANTINVRILMGHEPEFQQTGKELVERLGATIANPQTYQELYNVLRTSRIAVVLGHGWFDMKQASRSRIALNHGLRLTLRELQTLGLDGVEVVLLSCWSGWGVRSKLPLGELYSGPAAWMIGGAGAVLAPLWAIPIEAGSRFIGDYLEARICGKTRANALEYARQQTEFYDYGVICRAAYVLWGTDSL